MKTEFERRLAASKYVKEVFCKAEDHAVILFKCAAWAVESLASIRMKAQGLETDGGIREFPDLHRRNFEELGKEMDEFCRKVNQDMPSEVKKKD